MELLNYWPEFMAGLKEFQTLAETEQPEIAEALAAVRAAPEDFFVSTLTASGAERWEGLLSLPVLRGGELADRRFRIMTRAAEQRPFTMARL
ncbi:MAG: putative phage tail protein, partial [Lawsonibacter sp.]|nr:putative phage tail protein [Lawsonibacter sp.]